MDIWSDLSTLTSTMGCKQFTKNKKVVVMFRFFICDTSSFSSELFEEEEERHLLFLEMYSVFDEYALCHCNLEITRRIAFVTIGSELCVQISSMYAHRFTFTEPLLIIIRQFLLSLREKNFLPRIIDIHDIYFLNAFKSLGIVESDEVFVSNIFDV